MFACPKYEKRVLQKERINAKTTQVWKTFLCAVLGATFDGALRIEMQYHCWNGDTGEEMDSTKFKLKKTSASASGSAADKDFEVLKCTV